MKKPFRHILFALLAWLLVPDFPARADKLILLGDRTVTGTVLQTNDDSVLLLTDYGTLPYPRGIIKEIVIDTDQALARSKTNTFPDSRTVILLLNKQPWASRLKQIPATVIDKGILRNVPYISFRGGDDYEVNIYGDLDHPAGIEAGVYRTLLSDAMAKSNCIEFISSLLGPEADKALIKRLDAARDLKTFDGLSFEVTPPTAEDAYAGWWISVYSEDKLNLARATDEELKHITTGNAKASQDNNPAAWSPEELKLARPSQSYPSTITFTDSSGEVVTNAEVVRVIDGSSVIWRQGGSRGLVKLASLPESVRTQFGYDPAKAATADAEQQRKQAQLAAAVTRINTAQAAQVQDAPSVSDSDYSGYSPGGGRVYVRGYTRSNGTYVEPYTRSSPHRH